MSLTRDADAPTGPTPHLATGALLALVLLLNVHLSPKFIGPAGTVLCSNVACLV